MPGPGRIPLGLANNSFYLLIALIGVFALMFYYLWSAYPNRNKRGLEGYFEAAAIDLGFLLFAVALAVALSVAYGSGNRSAWALDRVVLGGYWLTFAIPVVTVASSVESRSHGRIPWRWPSVAVALAMFAALFLYYYYFVAV
jgi:cobalamin synthase